MGFEVGELTCFLGNVHYYENQIDYIDEYLRRYEAEEIPENKTQLLIDSTNWDGKIKNIKVEDFSLKDYNPLTPIRTNLSVGL